MNAGVPLCSNRDWNLCPVSDRRNRRRLALCWYEPCSINDTLREV